jgi:ABC-type sugar transport system ATPase subunit
MNRSPDGARLAFERVGVTFGATTVLDDVTTQFGRGEIVGLLGHNGAGKSTLINVATGALRSYTGQILVDGEALAAGSTPKSIAGQGVAVIHQEPALAPNLSVLDNLHLARDSATVRRAERVAKARAALDSLGAEQIRLDQPVETLSLGQRQMVDLARSVMLGDIKVLFLDEPTAALGEAETRSLHDIIRRLAAQGTTVVYVSHRLPDIIDVCTRIVALREGQLTLDAPVGSFTNASLSAALAGDKSLLDDEHRPTITGPALLTVEHEQELEFRPGEIVGLFGMAAGSQFAILQSLYGIGAGSAPARLDSAALNVAGPRSAVRQGVHLVPGDRERDGLIAGMSAFDNVFLPWLHDSTLSSRRTREQLYATMREALAIQGPEGGAPISTFSGGNRQKHLLARWIFPKRPTVLLLEQPTQGVDVGAKADIRRCLRSVAAEGTAIVIASAETDEIATLCDRAYVLSGSRSRPVAKSSEFQSELLSTLFDITAR